jgi:translation initiation factor 4E
VCLDGSQKKLDGKGLEAFALFKKGVQPRWEDEQNINGGHWEWRRTEVDPEVLDKMWTNVVLGESYGWDFPFWH